MILCVFRIYSYNTWSYYSSIFITTFAEININVFSAIDIPTRTRSDGYPNCFVDYVTPTKRLPRLQKETIIQASVIMFTSQHTELSVRMDSDYTTGLEFFTLHNLHYHFM